MKIRILQCDPVDPQAEDQVHRIRHQTGDLVIEYIQLVDAARRPEKYRTGPGPESQTMQSDSVLANPPGIDRAMERRVAGEDDQSARSSGTAARSQSDPGLCQSEEGTEDQR